MNNNNSNNRIPETVSFHLVKPCNMKCKFCYATFDDFKVKQQLSLINAITIVKKLAKAGVKKITFAGGEPMLYKELGTLLIYAKDLGLTTSIITNGSLLTGRFMEMFKDYLDWIGISIDSLNPAINIKIGRTSKNSVNYFKLIELIKFYNYKIKINTVVNAYNYEEDLNMFIDWVKPDRWKVFRTLRVKGQNDKQWDSIKVSYPEWVEFVNNHEHQDSIVIENNKAMTGSYLLIDPLGRLFENSKGEHTYSKHSLLTHSFNKCYSDINVDYDMFIRRGGIYNW